MRIGGCAQLEVLTPGMSQASSLCHAQAEAGLVAGAVVANQAVVRSPRTARACAPARDSQESYTAASLSCDAPEDASKQVAEAQARGLACGAAVGSAQRTTHRHNHRCDAAILLQLVQQIAVNAGSQR